MQLITISILFCSSFIPSAANAKDYVVVLRKRDAKILATTTVPPTGWDDSKPLYFSGTNCSTTASGNATLGYVKNARLEICGYLVKQYFDTSIAPKPLPQNVVVGTNQTSVTLNAGFDSCVAGDSKPVVIKFTLSDTSGNGYSISKSALAYNKAYVMGDTVNLPHASLAMLHAQYGFGTRYTLRMSSHDYAIDTLQNIPVYTGFYIWTHGGTEPCFYASYGGGRILDCANNPWNYSHYPQVKEYVAKKSRLQPVYNFVFIDACYSAMANSDSMSNAFGIYQSSQDRAYLGYTYAINEDGYMASWTGAVMESLHKGYTVQQAIDYANNNVGKPIFGDDIHYDKQEVPPRIIGDLNAKIHGVYGVEGDVLFK